MLVLVVILPLLTRKKCVIEDDVVGVMLIKMADPMVIVLLVMPRMKFEGLV